MINKVQVLPMKDGGNPRTEFEIKREEKGFFIQPFSEDDDGNYRFRLNVEVVNNNDNSVPVLFTIEWGDAEYGEDRNYVLLSRNDNHWERFDAVIQGSRAISTVDVPPGRSRLCLHPPYGFQRFLNLVDSLPRERFKVEVIGKSRRGRNIFAIEVGKEGSSPIAIMTRVHPYESIGSFFVDAMLKWLMEDGEEARELLSEKRLIFVPMPNPDGVAEGTCKRTLGGLNFSTNGSTTTEPEGVAVREYFRRMNPVAFYDFHGWMHVYDNFVTNDKVRGEKFYNTLKSYSQLFNKDIQVVYNKYPTVGLEKNLGGLLAKEADAVFYNSSWSWYGRDAQDLYEMGVILLKAYTSMF